MMCVRTGSKIPSLVWQPANMSCFPRKSYPGKDKTTKKERTESERREIEKIEKIELENTLVRRRLHSVQAIDALFTLFSSLLEPGAPEAGPADGVLGAIGRKGLDDLCSAMARKTEAYM